MDHNFWTQNPSRSSKLSKDSDCSRVSNENFSETQPSKALGPRPGEVGQCGLKVLHIWRHSQNIHNPQPIKFFKCRLEDLLRFFSLWTPINCFRRQSYNCAKPRAIQLFRYENPQKRLDTKVLTNYTHSALAVSPSDSCEPHKDHVQHQNSSASCARKLDKIYLSNDLTHKINWQNLYLLYLPPKNINFKHNNWLSTMNLRWKHVKMPSF